MLVDQFHVPGEAKRHFQVHAELEPQIPYLKKTAGAKQDHEEACGICSARI